MNHLCCVNELNYFLLDADQNSGVTFQKAKQILQSFETEVAETIFSDNVRCQCEVVEAILSCFPDEARRLDVTPVYQLPPLLNSLVGTCHTYYFYILFFVNSFFIILRKDKLL